MSLYDLQPGNKVVPLDSTGSNSPDAVKKRRVHIQLPSINDRVRQKLIHFPSGHEIILTPDIRAVDVLFFEDEIPTTLELIHVRDDGQDPYVWLQGSPSPINVDVREEVTLVSPKGRVLRLEEDGPVRFPQPTNKTDAVNQTTPSVPENFIPPPPMKSNTPQSVGPPSTPTPDKK